MEAPVEAQPGSQAISGEHRGRDWGGALREGGALGGQAGTFRGD